MQLITNENRELRSEASEPKESLRPSTRKPGRQRPGNIACGQWDNYRTIFGDFMVLYLFGLRLIEA